MAKAHVAMATEGVSVGDHVTCCVLDLDTETGHYWVTMNSKLTSENKLDDELTEKKHTRQKKKKVAVYRSHFKVISNK